MEFSIIVCCFVSLVVLQRIESTDGFTNPIAASYEKFPFLMQGVITYQGGSYASFPVCMVTQKFGISAAHVVTNYSTFVLKRDAWIFPGDKIYTSPSTVIDFPNIRFDISVWQLKADIPFYVNVIPASYSGASPTVGEHLITVGFEKNIPISSNSSSLDASLALANVVFINVQSVRLIDGAIWYDNFPIESAGRSDNSSDVRFMKGNEQVACGGDSGSPVLREIIIPGCDDTTKHFELIGPTSFGKDDCTAFHPFGIFDVTEAGINRFVSDTIIANSSNLPKRDTQYTHGLDKSINDS